MNALLVGALLGLVLLCFSVGVAERCEMQAWLESDGVELLPFAEFCFHIHPLLYHYLGYKSKDSHIRCTWYTC